MTIDALLNHLVQSTAFCGLAALLVLALRKNAARVRHAVWMVASMKFLVPFAALAMLGSYIPRPAAHLAPLALPIPNLVVIAQPFSSQPDLNFTPIVQVATHHDLVGMVLFGIWLCGFLAVIVSFLARWRRVAAILNAAKPVDPIPCPAFCGTSLTARVTNAALEPGVFGIFRPILLLPDGIAERLSEAQLAAVVAHELCHVRRRDNLTAALHMLVEAVFWFHPLVWWMGTRLVEERERACDEAVLTLGSDPDAYAEGIVQVCRFYVESPLACVAGVTGADLKRRVVAIMSNRLGRNLSFFKKTLLTGLGIAAIAGPLAAGLAVAPRIEKPKTAPILNSSTAKSSSKGSAEDLLPAAAPPKPVFEAASVKPSQAPGGDTVVGNCGGGPGTASPDRFTCRNVDLAFLVANAFGIPFYGLPVSGSHPQLTAPSWMDYTNFDLTATIASGTNPDQFRSMQQNLLVQRFRLAMHHEMRQMAGYDLTLANGGSKLKASAQLPDSAHNLWGAYLTDSGPPKQGPDNFYVMLPGMTGGLSNIIDGVEYDTVQHEDIAFMIRKITHWLQAPVTDLTGLTGAYDYKLSFSPYGLAGSPNRPNAPPSPPDADVPTLFVALREQLGLELVQKQSTFDVLAVDHSEKTPSGN